MMSSSPEDHSKLMKQKGDLAAAFLDRNGFDLVQRNGQRISTSRTTAKPESNENTEVFIGRLPRDLFEDELVPLMSMAGNIYKIRLMMDFSLSNRGFCYIQYSNPLEAQIACLRLNQVHIRPKCQPIGVVRSFDNKRLYFHNLPLQVTEQQLFGELNKLLDGVIDVKIPEPAFDSDKRFAFVTFKSHEAATDARRLLLPGDVKILDQTIKIDWAKPDKRNKDDSLTNLSLMPIEQKPLNQNLVHLPGATIWRATPAEEDFSIIVKNINSRVTSLTKFKRIFQLAQQLKITQLKFISYDTLKIVYGSRTEADLMYETLLLCPLSFSLLSLPGRTLEVFRYTSAQNMINIED